MFQFLEDESHRAATLAWKNVVVIVDNSLIGMELEQRIFSLKNNKHKCKAHMLIIKKLTFSFQESPKWPRSL